LAPERFIDSGQAAPQPDALQPAMASTVHQLLFSRDGLAVQGINADGFRHKYTSLPRLRRYIMRGHRLLYTVHQSTMISQCRCWWHHSVKLWPVSNTATHSQAVLKWLAPLSDPEAWPVTYHVHSVGTCSAVYHCCVCMYTASARHVLGMTDVLMQNRLPASASPNLCD